MRRSEIAHWLGGIVWITALIQVSSAARASTSARLQEAISSRDSVRVVTYNTGLAEWQKIDLVPCVGLRLQLQIRELEKQLALESHWIVLLQEVWSNRYYDEFRAMAGRMHASISVTDVRGRGLVVITSGHILNEAFAPFPRDSFATSGNRRGMLAVCCECGGDTILAITTHTAFSSAKHPSSIHLRQLKNIVSYCDSISRTLPTNAIAVLGGDFNAGADMKYRNQTYDPVQEIWIPFEARLKAVGWRLLPLATGVSWDAQKNPLIYTGAKMLWKRIIWEELSCTLDHLFLLVPASGDRSCMVSRYSRLFLDQPVDYGTTCENWCVEPGRGYLSDHFAVESFLMAALYSHH